MLNQVQIMGRLTKNPELRYTTVKGIPVLSFAVACDRRIFKDREQETDFYNVVAWQSTAEFIAKYFTKGQMICIDGRLQQRTYTDEKTGVTHYPVEIVAESVHFAGYKRDDNQDNSAAHEAEFDPFASKTAA